MTNKPFDRWFFQCEGYLFIYLFNDKYWREPTKAPPSYVHRNKDYYVKKEKEKKTQQIKQNKNECLVKLIKKKEDADALCNVHSSVDA